MKYGSVSSGIEAPTVAWHPLGWKPVWFSEIAKFPSSVLKHHYPQVPNLGDMTKLNQHEIYHGTDIDLLVGGTPCQSFSIAGLRGGLGDDRGNLALEYCRILLYKQPRWFVWENVPGVFSSTGGSDFLAILRGFRECGYSIAYRVLDSQYFGVPQRRRRVFVVGYFGNDWRPPAAVLFESESLRRDFTPSREKGKEVAGTLDARTNGGGFPGSDGAMSGHVLAFGGNNTSGEIDLAAALNAAASKSGRMDFDSETFLVHEAPILYSIMPQNSSKDYKAREVPVTQPLMAGGPVGGNQGGDYVLHPIPFDTTQITSKANGSNPQPGDPCHPLTSCGHVPAISCGKTIIRRLTPLECERLQGFPDNYTNVPGASDSARYAAIGNSMTTHVMRWIGERIQMVDQILIAPVSQRMEGY